MSDALKRLDAIDKEIAGLKKKKQEIKEMCRGDKEAKLLFRDEMREIRHKIKLLARERSQLPITLKWSGEELKRRETA